MNRPLKFRIAYISQNGEKSMIYSDNDRFLITLDGRVLENYGKDFQNPLWEIVFDSDEPPVIQEYTGLNDKNGKEIYEGDIVSTIYSNDPQHNIGEVIYHKDTGSFRIKAINQLLPIVTFRFVENKPEGLLQVVDKVIGNIFENPELLK